MPENVVPMDGSLATVLVFRESDSSDAVSLPNFLALSGYSTR